MTARDGGPAQTVSLREHGELFRRLIHREAENALLRSMVEDLRAELHAHDLTGALLALGGSEARVPNQVRRRMLDWPGIPKQRA